MSDLSVNSSDPTWHLPLSATDYLSQLVACNTVSSTEPSEDHSTTALVDLMVRHFTANHLFCLKFEQIPGKFNLLALSLGALKQLKSSDHLGLLFSGHADTVPFNASAWHTDPLVLTAQDGKLYGRGSVDMKGFLACAAAVLGAQNTPSNSAPQTTPQPTSQLIGDQFACSCLITSDEETSMDGAVMMSQLSSQPLHSLGCSVPELIYDQAWAQTLALHDSEFKAIWQDLPQQTVQSEQPNQPAQPDQPQLAGGRIEAQSWLDQAFMHKSFDLIVIGEPTSMEAVIAHKGWMARTLKVQGKTAHSSNPALGRNALSLLLPVMQELEGFAQELQTQHTDQRFAVPYVTLNLGKIQGGQAHNTVCDMVSLDFDARPIPCYSNQQVQERLQSIVDRYNQQQPSATGQPSYELIIPFADIDCFENSDLKSLDMLKQALEQVRNTNRELPLSTDFQCVNYCTEASLLQKLGPCVVMGPGSIAQAHQENEYIEHSQLELCVQVLLALIAGTQKP